MGGLRPDCLQVASTHFFSPTNNRLYFLHTKQKDIQASQNAPHIDACATYLRMIVASLDHLAESSFDKRPPLDRLFKVTKHLFTTITQLTRHVIFCFKQWELPISARFKQLASDANNLSQVPHSLLTWHMWGRLIHPRLSLGLYLQVMYQQMVFSNESEVSDEPKAKAGAKKKKGAASSRGVCFLYIFVSPARAFLLTPTIPLALGPAGQDYARLKGHSEPHLLY